MRFMGILWDTLRKNASHTRIQLETWLQGLDISAAAVADVGGKKLPVKDRVKSWNVERYDTLDLPEYDLNKPWELEEIYDAVFCLEVFEYIYNPLQAMQNLYKMLKSGGVLYASFHFVYPHHSAQAWIICDISAGEWTSSWKKPNSDHGKDIPAISKDPGSWATSIRAKR